MDDMAGVSHISRDEAVKHAAAVLDRAGSGEAFAVELPNGKTVHISAGNRELPRTRTLSETLALLRASEMRNEPAIPDEQFASDARAFREELNRILSSQGQGLGVILDTNLLIEAERKSTSISDMVSRLPLAPDTPLAVSVLTLTELATGVARAKLDQQKVGRQRFLNEVRNAFMTVSLDESMAIEAGIMRGNLQSSGETIDIVDLLIGVTALSLNYAVATKNVRHFRMIPGLRVIEV